MKSSQHILPRDTPSTIKKGKRLRDIKSKSIVSLKSIIMSSIRNQVHLLGNVGQAPVVTTLESGKKVARFSMATNEHYKNAKGEKETQTYWHNVVAWGKTAGIVESFVGKGKEIAVCGKLKTRSYTTDTGESRYITEVEANEILLLGSKSDT
jgi:single-strand DNA-binding protein